MDNFWSKLARGSENHVATSTDSTLQLRPVDAGSQAGIVAFQTTARGAMKQAAKEGMEASPHISSQFPGNLIDLVEIVFPD